MLPNLEPPTWQYLCKLYKHVEADSIVACYQYAEHWIREHVEPKHCMPGNVHPTVINIAVMHVHFHCARTSAAKQHARFGMHALASLLKNQI